ncbi:hypothetical protein LTR28_011836, partial [Elasticomyces elasticus]
MNTSFSRFTELSQTEDVGPNLRLQMQEMSRQFADMARRSLIDEDGSVDVREEEQRHSGSVGSADERVSEHGDASAARDAPLLTSQGAGDTTNVRTANQTSAHPGIGYPAFPNQTNIDDDMEETPAISPQPVARPASINDMAITPYRGNSPLRMRSPTVPDLDIRVTLAAPYTYSYQETTFARQLHRACIERGHKLLSDVNRNRKTYEYCIGLTLSHSTHERLLSWFEKMLRKTTNESLDNWATPLLHIGGAGRHYPRLDEFGQVMSLPSSSNLRSIGPQKVASAHAFGKQANADVPSTPDMLVDLAGYEGEWFDPYDVEGYLAEKGIRIGPRAFFAEADVTYAPSSRDNFSDTAAASNTSATLSATSVSNPQTPYEIGHESFATESTAFAANAATTASDMLPESGHVLFGADPGFSNVGYSDVYTGGYANYLPGMLCHFEPRSSYFVNAEKTQGTIGTKRGLMASAANSMQITLHGRGGHASQPHRLIDPVVMAASTVMRLQTIVSREVDPADSAVITCGSIQAGDTENIVVDDAILKLNVRTISPETREHVLSSIERIVRAE